MRTIYWTVCAAALAFAPQAFAQGATKDAGTKERPTTNASAEKGAPLYKLSHIVDAELKNDSDASCGEIDGLVVDPSNGMIVYALVGEGGVLGIGETERLVPWESIRIVPKEKGDGCIARTKLTKEQIERAPAFKKNTVIDTEAERTARTVAGLSADGIVGRGPSTRLISSADVDGATVRGFENKDLGKIDELVVAPREAMVAYVVLESGGVLGMGEKRVALPWPVVETSWSDDKKLVLSTPVTKERLQSAPHFDDKEWNRMSTTVWVDELCKYHACDSFSNRAMKASAPKKMNN